MTFQGLRIALCAALVFAALSDAAPTCDPSVPGSCSAGDDSSTMLQSRVAAEVEGAEVEDADDAEETGDEHGEENAEETSLSEEDLEGYSAEEREALSAFRYRPEMASAPHQNAKGAEFFAEIRETCGRCARKCQKKQLAAVFVLCDKKKDKKLSNTEVLNCFFDGDIIDKGTGKNHKANIQVSKAVMTLSDSQRFIDGHDKDGDKMLNQAEFFTSAQSGEGKCKKDDGSDDEEDEEGDLIQRQLLTQRNQELSETTTTSNCVADVAKNVWKTVTSTCSRSVNVKDCWKSWKFWTGAFWSCRWKTVTETFTCMVNKLVKVVQQVVAGFADCWKSVLAWFKDKVGGPFMDLISACNSIQNCLDELLKGPKALWNKIVDLVKKAVDAVMNASPIGSGIKYVGNIIKKIPPTFKSVKGIAVDTGVAIGKFIKGAIHAIRNQPHLNMCTTPGMGFWYYKPTDCGAFGRMKDIFKISNIASIPGIFADVVKKFGTCLIKLGVLSLPSPFLDVKVKSWCIPSPLQTFIKGIVGTFVFVINQIKAGLAGCSGSHANQPVCVLVSDLKSIGDKIKNIFVGNFMQQTAELIGERVHGDKNHFGLTTGSDGKIGCGSYSWAVSVGLAGVTAYPPEGDTIGMGFTLQLGCRAKTLILDFLFGVAGGLFIAGFDAGPPAAKKFGYKPKLAFALDLPWGSGAPGNDIIQWGASVDIAGKVRIGNAICGVGLGFKILPKPALPTGFSVNPSCEAEALLESERRQQELDDAVEAAETTEDKYFAHVGTILKQFMNMDMVNLFESGAYMESMDRGASHFGNVVGQHLGQGEANNQVAFPIAPKEISLSAGLSVNFCVTCAVFLNRAGRAGVIAPPGGVSTPIVAAAATASNLPLYNHWASYGGSYGTATYITAGGGGATGGGMCVVEGLIRGGSNWHHMSTLPVGCRPKRRLIFNQNNHAKTARVDVDTNGVISWHAGGKDHHWMSLSGIAFPMSGEANLQLANRWVTYGGAYGTASYMKNGGLCMANGLIKNGGWGHTATLPAGCRPTKRLIFNLNNHESTSRVDVETNGKISWVTGGKNHNWVSLSGINFGTDASTETGVPLVSPWVGYQHGYGNPGLSLHNGLCVVNGLIRYGAWNKLAVLPASCRPARRLIFNLNNHAKTARVDVLTNGEIHWVTGGKDHHWISLSGIIFNAAR